jgi:hypothetical protein
MMIPGHFSIQGIEAGAAAFLALLYLTPVRERTALQTFMSALFASVVGMLVALAVSWSGKDLP